MAAQSDIEWTNSSWTPIRARNRKTGKVGWHCEHATTGCEFCYAEGLNKWFGTGLLFKPGHRKDIEIFLDGKMLTAPLRWKKPRMVFCCSMTDLFADFVTDEWIDKIFAVMALCPQHTFQVLTKRAERMREYCDKWGKQADIFENPLNAKAGYQTVPWPLPNVWLGVSCERQQEVDERIPFLLQTPAAVRFISAEPLLGPIDLQYGLHALDGLDWVIVGGESGPHARPMYPGWARSLRDQCHAAGVAYFFKQWGEHIAETVPGTCVDLRYDLKPNQSVTMGDGKTNHTRYTRVGKKAAGRLLDGREHNEFPSSAT